MSVSEFPGVAQKPNWLWCANGRADTGIGAECALTTTDVTSPLSIMRMKLSCPNRLSMIAKAARLGRLTTVRDLFMISWKLD